MIGAGMVHLHIGNGLHNLLYTGDQKYGRSLLLDQAETHLPLGYEIMRLLLGPDASKHCHCPAMDCDGDSPVGDALGGSI